MAIRDDDPVVFTFFNEIGIIDQLAQNLLEHALPDGLKMSHFVVLNHFARLGGARSPQDLARAIQVTKGAMTNTLKRLKTRGLVEIQPDPDDGRAKRVTLKAVCRARSKCSMTAGSSPRAKATRLSWFWRSGLSGKLRYISSAARSFPRVK